MPRRASGRRDAGTSTSRSPCETADEAATRNALGLDDGPDSADRLHEEFAASDEEAMLRAVELGESVRGTTAPNPWVGALVVTPDGQTFEGATEPPPGRHAEIVALDAARAARAETAGATLHTTLEPCSHTGRTPPCVDAIIDAGIARVCAGVTDPDPQVAGAGMTALRAAGIDTAITDADGAAEASLRPYLHQRQVGRPWVVLKLAATLDGRIAAPDGTSQWITSPEARTDVHALRARCDAVLVGAGTVRADNPRLTVRKLPDDDSRRPLLALRDGHRAPTGPPVVQAAAARLDPRRFVLGKAGLRKKIRPCEQVNGPLAEVLAGLAADGVVELLVEGGATVAGQFHRAGAVDEYVVYLAPEFMGGDDGLPMLSGPGAPTINDLGRGTLTDVRIVGGDLRITVIP